MKPKKKTKYIFVTGGVVSGLGKGISIATIASLLKLSGYQVNLKKMDPYLNIDPGTMSPFQHGEVFITADGAETDLDLGHYERFLDIDATKQSNVTAGQVYQSVLERERQGSYQGHTVQVIPHITDFIKERIYEQHEDFDFVLAEIGGTIGDIESLPFLEAVRQIVNEQGANNTFVIHVALAPFLKINQEFKTKPIQHSVKELLSHGVQPNAIIVRSQDTIANELLRKIALFCNVKRQLVFNIPNLKTIYHVPSFMGSTNIIQQIETQLQLEHRPTTLTSWDEFTNKINASQQKLSVHLVGKYTDFPDAYLSLIEALMIAGYEHGHQIKIIWTAAESLTPESYETKLANSQAILIPGGFGDRGLAGKMLAAQYARTHNVPFLGICLGMQAAVLEFARHQANLPTAHSQEFTSKGPLLFHLINQDPQLHLGGTLRLGNYLIRLKKDTQIARYYQKTKITERHRHRYEFNNEYQAQLEQAGLVFSGFYEPKNLVETVELPNLKFFVGIQYHPEFTSRPNKPNPLFYHFLAASLTMKPN